MWAFYDLNSPYKTTKVQQRYKTFIWRCTCNKSCIQFMICQISLLRAHFCIFNKDHSCSNTCIMIAFFSFWDIQRMNINHSRHTFKSIALTHTSHAPIFAYISSHFKYLYLSLIECEHIFLVCTTCDECCNNDKAFAWCESFFSLPWE